MLERTIDIRVRLIVLSTISDQIIKVYYWSLDSLALP